ncbi:NINE protein [Noviherbaspirillum sp. UKPF54]|uniref:NINE protein n=1 Tax=Noviherbaspirillum sp. UKPF54 TaxID=2601898 RepID=UPI0011B12DAB|nr:TM2 domain-containing protein [Noviherbaspirillum sp. UKPF54]QDZ26882.1 TM2 domain-containing protein [Noviherbaspirillum sp. UKPF54]
MSTFHKNKTVATLLAFVAGGLGAHRFYLYNRKDPWAWIHLASVPLSLLLRLLAPAQPSLFVAAPLAISVLSGFIEALVVGLTPDDKWDARHNATSGRRSESGWPLAVLLVLTLGVGAVALIAAIARSFDLLFTGGAYG